MNDFHPLFFGDKPDVLIEFEQMCAGVYARTGESPVRFVVSPGESFALTFYYTGRCDNNAPRISQIVNEITRQLIPIEVSDPPPPRVEPTADLDDTVELPVGIEGRTEIVTVRQLVQRYETQRESIEWLKART